MDRSGFARGAQEDVPRALRSIARREFHWHGLHKHEPVLTVGPPDNFETHESDLFSYLFEGLFIATHDAKLDDLRERKLSIISVPYIEGTRALWHPIVVGHEIAHVRLDHIHSFESRVNLTRGWIERHDPDWQKIQEDRWERRPGRVSPRDDVLKVLEGWVNEVLCDLNSVRRFGPAGMSAIAEFLALIDAASGVPDRLSETHPPLSARLAVMLRYLGRLGYDDLPEHARVWRGYVETNTPVANAETNYLLQVLTKENHQDAMAAYVETWGPAYKASAAELVDPIDWIREELLDGIPGGTHYPGEPWQVVEVPDVVNAAWGARSVVDASAVEDRAAPENGVEAVDDLGALLSSGLEPHEQRWRIDSLASKAIDSIELSELWGQDRGAIGLDQLPLTEAAAGSPATAEPGVLSRSSIADRLTADRKSRRRLVVTPLFEDSLQDAGIDIRLGPDFIVFRHSATTAFDPVLHDQDPRILQERVHKGWGQRFVLHPGELVLASTLEYIVVPEDIVAQVITRSSYGRLGLITATAVQVQPGSRGCITLELVNHADTPIALSPGLRVAQLVFFCLSAPTSIVPGKYWFPVGPEFSKVHDDKDAIILRRIAQESVAVGGLGPLKVTFAAPRSEAWRFDEIARERGIEMNASAIDLDPLTDTDGGRSVSAEALSFLILSGSLAIAAIGDLAMRWRKDRKQSVAIVETSDGVEITNLPDIEPGLVIIRDRNGLEVDRVAERGTAAEIADAVARMAGRKAPEPPRLDYPE